MARCYHEKPFQSEDFHSASVILYKFQFYAAHADLVLAFHRAKVSTTLLDIITDCEITRLRRHGNLLDLKIISSIFLQALCNMMLCWLERGMRETPEARADMFLRIASNFDWFLTV